MPFSPKWLTALTANTAGPETDPVPTARVYWEKGTLESGLHVYSPVLGEKSFGLPRIRTRSPFHRDALLAATKAFGVN